MNNATRLNAAFDLQCPDRPPILGGWLAAPGHIQALTGCSDDAYWADSFRWSVKAEQVLGSDGVITIFVPVKRGAYRCVDHDVRERRAAHTMESILADIAALPEPSEVRAAVRQAMAVCRDQASLVFFTSNTITPDCPLENVRAFWDEVQQCRW